MGLISGYQYVALFLKSFFFSVLKGKESLCAFTFTPNSILFSLLFFFFRSGLNQHFMSTVLGIDPMTSHVQDMCSTTELHPQISCSFSSIFPYDLGVGQNTIICIRTSRFLGKRSRSSFIYSINILISGAKVKVQQVQCLSCM